MPLLSASDFTYNSVYLKEAYRGPSLPPAWEQRLKQEAWYRLFLPRALNGLQLKLSEGLELLIETAAVQGSLGWRVKLGAGAGFFAGCMPRATAAEIYGKPGSLVSGSGAVSGMARKVSGGFRLSGRWEHCTGAPRATAFTFNARTEDAHRRTFIVKPDDVIIHPHWPYWALKATETYPVTVQEAFIPDEYVFDIRRAQHFPEYRLYDLDFMLFARACMAASYVGMALCVCRRAAQEFSLSRYTALRAGAQALEEKAHSLRSTLLARAEELEDNAGILSEHLLREHLNPGIQEMGEISWQMFREGGMELCREDSLTHQALKDFWLAGRHFLNR